MTNETQGVNLPLTGHIITYDYDQPSPYFTQEHREFINLIQEFLPEKAVKSLQKYEFFKTNVNVVKYLGQNSFFYSVLSGLRPEPGYDCLYLRRFSNDSHRNMLNLFVKHATRNFLGVERVRWSSNGFRVILPNGDRFYPIRFNTDLDLWRPALREAADHYHTVLGHFDRGRFIVSDGQTFEFMQLKAERCLLPDYPDDW